MVRNKVADCRRRRYRHPTADVAALQGSAKEPAAPEDDAAEREEGQRLMGRLRESLDRLRSGRYRDKVTLLELHYLEGKTIAEIANALRKTHGQVKGCLRRAREAVRRVLGFDPKAPT